MLYLSFETKNSVLFTTLTNINYNLYLFIIFLQAPLNMGNWQGKNKNVYSC